MPQLIRYSLQYQRVCVNLASYCHGFSTVMKSDTSTNTLRFSPWPADILPRDPLSLKVSGPEAHPYWAKFPTPAPNESALGVFRLLQVLNSPWIPAPVALGKGI